MSSSAIELLNFSFGKKVPVILQSEAAECGLASLAMVANYHGHKTDLNTLRLNHSFSLKGATLQDLIKISNELKLSSRALRLDLEDITNLATPCILHWDMNHFVVLQSATSSKVVIHDPGVGKRTYSYAELSKHFTGVALELTPTSEFKKKKEVSPLKLSSFWSKISGLKRTLFQILLMSLLLQIFALVSPFYTQLVVDDVLLSHDTDLLTILAFGFGFVVIFNVVTNALRSFIILYLSTQLNIQMASNLFNHMLHLPMAYFEKRHIGDIVSRFGSLDAVKQMMTTGLIQALVDGVMVIGTLILMFIYSPKLSVVVIIATLIYTLFRLALYAPLKQLTEETIVAGAKEDSNFMETVRGMQSVKLFGREPQRQAVWQNFYAEAMNSGIKLGKLNITYETANMLLFGLENILVIYFAAKLVMVGDGFSVGMLFAFMSYKGQFTGKAAGLVSNFIEFKMLSLHMDRIADIALSEREKNHLSTRPFSEIEGSIQLEKLSFRYSDSEPYIAKDLSVEIKAGESIAIVGSSGCGKTTLMKIMLGLLDATEGKVIIDDQDIEVLGMKNYRTQIATVMQNDTLLSGTISDNISFFDPLMDMERVEEVAKLAAIHQDILSMPMGYNTLIGDMGNTLSGGQIQRILLARALYKKPKILFLDEATSNLDVHLESIVNHAVKELNITRIIVAHRPETIRSADRVLTMHAGQLYTNEEIQVLATQIEP